MNIKKMCVIIVGFNNGGVEKLLYNYFINMDLSNLIIDFICCEALSEQCKEEFEKIANNIFFIPPKKKNFIKYINSIKTILKNGKYDIVHSNLSQWNSIPMYYSKKYKVPIRISHSHIVLQHGFINKIILKINRHIIRKNATSLIGCSNDACHYLYGKNKGKILYNGIDFNNYYYKKESRNLICKKYMINTSRFIIGNIGRLSTQKNQEFLLEIAKEFKKNNDNACFLCVGCGELENKLKREIIKDGLEDYFILAGETNDPSPFYSSFDCFCFPSLYEGLGIALVEAQISGLRCIISNNVPKDAIISNRVLTLYLSNFDIKEWYSTIMILKNDSKMYDREDTKSFLLENANRYSIYNNIEDLRKIYGLE